MQEEEFLAPPMGKGASILAALAMAAGAVTIAVMPRASAPDQRPFQQQVRTPDTLQHAAPGEIAHAAG